MKYRSQVEGEESQSLVAPQRLNNYQTVPDSSYEWNVEIDVKGQVHTGETYSDKFCFKKLMQYSGPGKSLWYNILESVFLIKCLF